MTELIEFGGNHLILVSAFFFISALLIVNLIQAGGSKALLPIEAVQMMNREGAIPLDIRGASDYADGHIINAKNIPAAELKTKHAELKKLADQPVLVYCATGQTSLGALKELNAAGVEQVYSLKGGIAAWRSDNLPLT